MNKDDVPFYNDPMGFTTTATYPCDTQFMTYNVLNHRYYLTEFALNYYGLDVEGKYISDSNNKVQEFIEKVSRKVYDYITYKAGLRNAPVQVYRIATAPKNLYADSYTFRKAFEQALASEAKWLLTNGDKAEFSGVDIKEKRAYKPEEDWEDTSDIATEVKRFVHSFGLDKYFRIGGVVWLDESKY